MLGTVMEDSRQRGRGWVNRMVTHRMVNAEGEVAEGLSGGSDFELRRVGVGLVMGAFLSRRNSRSQCWGERGKCGEERSLEQLGWVGARSRRQDT